MVDGMVFPRATRRVNVAGRQVSGYLLELLQRRCGEGGSIDLGGARTATC